MAKTKKDILWPTDKELRQELDQINRQLKEAYERFNYACEPELVEASIFEINALKAKYDYLLRCVKERSGMPVNRRAAVPAAQEAVEKVSLGLVLLFLLVAIWRLFKTPMKLALRLAGNTALGFGAVWALNLTTAYTGLSLGLNLFNALTVAILGLPGFCLLLLVKWVLGT